MAGREEMSTSFGRMAQAYEVGRPEYPAESVAFLLQPVASHEHLIRVADVGAGTGKLTRVLVETGAEVVAIDPDPMMLEALRAAVPAVPTFLGTGERLPLPDAGLDAVVFGQSWHWVDPPAASREVARTLRSGGVLGLIWNVRDESVEWVARMTGIMHGSSAEEMLAGGAPPVAEPFGDLARHDISWERRMTRADLFAMVHSRSYYITGEDAERARIDAELGVLFDEIGAVGDAAIAMPYATRAFRGIRP
jgi:SAM-dependent methyltransferase